MAIMRNKDKKMHGFHAWKYSKEMDTLTSQSPDSPACARLSSVGAAP